MGGGTFLKACAKIPRRLPQATQSLHFMKPMMLLSHALYLNIKLNWSTATSRMFSPATCMPHKDGLRPFCKDLRLRDKKWWLKFV